MAAGITDRLWSVEDIAELVDAAAPKPGATSLEQNGKPFAGIDPAPEQFHKMWEKRAGNFKPSHPSAIKDDVAVELALCA